MRHSKYKNKWQRALSTIQQKERDAGSSRGTSPNREKNTDVSDSDSATKKDCHGEPNREELKHSVVVTDSSKSNDIAEGKEQSGKMLAPPPKPTGTGSTSPQPQSEETKQDFDLAQ